MTEEGDVFHARWQVGILTKPRGYEPKRMVMSVVITLLSNSIVLLNPILLSGSLHGAHVAVWLCGSQCVLFCYLFLM